MDKMPGEKPGEKMAVLFMEKPRDLPHGKMLDLAMNNNGLEKMRFEPWKIWEILWNQAERHDCTFNVDLQFYML